MSFKSDKQVDENNQFRWILDEALERVTVDGIIYENVWKLKTEQLLEEISLVWARDGAHPVGDSPIDRAKEAVFIAREPGGMIIGLSTAKPSMVNQLNLHMFVYRSYVSPAFRRRNILRRITILSRDFLEAIHQRIQPVCAGIIAEIQSKELEGSLNQVVYPTSGLALIGFTKSGNQLRAFYFKNATL